MPQQTAVKDIMSAEVVSIDPDLKVNQALEIMGSSDVRRLPVVGRSGRLVGIITEADARLAMPRGRSLYGEEQEIPTVRDTMTDNVITVTPEDTIAHVAQLMRTRKIAGIPVIEAGALVGIVTESDIFRFVVALFEENDNGFG